MRQELPGGFGVQQILTALFVLTQLGCANTPTYKGGAIEAQDRALARFAAIVCHDLLKDQEGELHRVDHLDSKGHVRVILPKAHHAAFRESLSDHYLGLARVQLLDEEGGRALEIREPHLTFFIERNDWGVWYRCVAETERPASDGVFLGGYSDSWWVTDGGVTFRLCFRHVR